MVGARQLGGGGEPFPQLLYACPDVAEAGLDQTVGVQEQGRPGGRGPTGNRVYRGPDADRSAVEPQVAVVPPRVADADCATSDVPLFRNQIAVAFVPSEEMATCGLSASPPAPERLTGVPQVAAWPLIVATDALITWSLPTVVYQTAIALLPSADSATSGW